MLRGRGRYNYLLETEILGEASFIFYFSFWCLYFLGKRRDIAGGLVSTRYGKYSKVSTLPYFKYRMLSSVPPERFVTYFSSNYSSLIYGDD